MSRKGNCLDNAPIESFFHLFKTELLDGFPPCRDLAELQKLSTQYIHFFKNKRYDSSRIPDSYLSSLIIRFYLTFLFNC
ncbi:IS3 family transposase [Limosilactobacillus difficilis]|uniref:IS3 family transposase n=1 Tax=Limosilactobacillus difficilis TaxID=2991838 RepID=UPI0038CBFD98